MIFRECTFEDEVRKSATDIHKWEEDQKSNTMIFLLTQIEKRELIESGKHPFLTNHFSSEVNISEEPILTILNQIAQAKAEMQLVQQLLRDIHAPAGSDPVFRQTMHVIPSEERGEDLARTRRTRVANLESTYILFEEASNQFQDSITKLRKRVEL